MWYTWSHLCRMLWHMTGMCGKQKERISWKWEQQSKQTSWWPTRRKHDLIYSHSLSYGKLLHLEDILEIGPILQLYVYFSILLCNYVWDPMCIPSSVLPVRWLRSIISSYRWNPFSGSADPTKDWLSLKKGSPQAYICSSCNGERQWKTK